MTEFQNLQETFITIYGIPLRWLIVFTLAGSVLFSILEAARVFMNWLAGLMKGGD